MLGYVSAAWAAIFKKLFWVQAHWSAVKTHPEQVVQLWLYFSRLGSSVWLCVSDGPFSKSGENRMGEAFWNGKWSWAVYRYLPGAMQWQASILVGAGGGQTTGRNRALSLKSRWALRSANWNCYASPSLFSALFQEGSGIWETLANAIQIRLFSCFMKQGRNSTTC